MVALGEFTLSVIPLQPAIPPPFLPTSYDKFLQYGMECQQAFMTFREKIPQSVRQILMLIEFLIVYSAAISWVVHLPLAVGRVGLKYTRYVLADSRTCWLLFISKWYDIRGLGISIIVTLLIGSYRRIMLMFITITVIMIIIVMIILIIKVMMILVVILMISLRIIIILMMILLIIEYLPLLMMLY